MIRRACQAVSRAEVRLPDRVFLAASVALALALRLPRMKIAYWGDEAISLGIASRPLGQIPRYLRADGSPPLYYVLLHYWMRIFGTSGVATHSLSLLFSLAAIPVAWWCARSLFGHRLARLAAFLAAVSPYLAYYGTETRMYALVAVVSMLAVTGFVRMLQLPPGPIPGLWGAVRPVWRWLLLAVAASSAATYTHNWGLFLVGALTLVGGVTAWRNRDIVRGWRTVIYGSVVALAYIPWIPNLLEQIRYTGAPWSPRPSVLSLVLTPLNAWFSGVSSLVDIAEFSTRPRVDLGFLLPWLGAVTALLVILVLWLRGHAESRDHGEPPVGVNLRERRGLVGSPLTLTMLILAVELAAAWCASQFVRAWTPRYLGVIIAPLLVVLPGAVGRFQLVRRLLPLLVGVMTLVALPVLLDPPGAVATKSNVAVVDATMRPELTRGDVVITTDMSELPVIAYYLPHGMRYGTPLGPVADPNVVDWVNLTSRLAQANPQATLARLLASLPVGGRVLIVDPTNWAAAGAPPRYSGIIAAEGIAVNQDLLNSPNFTVIRTVRPRSLLSVANPVEGILLVKSGSS